ncbi:DUF2946 domain-containing protein [Xenorhabdus sp. IM139775]|uniref:DUF2946 domain-containing protein n=1 Tax=Xenorhabdus sp. IM139775 TaxID=3025876 RepID=UPI00235910ED|nr:DUF2946 domain-containing protein [Xenorhabdus sp. IM139775]MDC9592421.1 DUF2946 domain-containing protein [Xenorhabdus sp. IM139775]
MLSLFHLSQRRTPAIIALLAILMLFIAPVISKTLEHSREGIKAHAMNHHGADHVHMGLMDDIACGYCQLLINLPLLTGGFVPFILLTIIVSRVPPTQRFSGPIIRLFYGESQPRAPPLN